jgi:hypothetical protein
MLGKAVETAASLLFMTPEQGSESALWALTAPAVVERREEVHGGYFSEADGKVSLSCRPIREDITWHEQAGTETDQAKDEVRAKKLWDLSVKVLKEKAKYDVQL